MYSNSSQHSSSSSSSMEMEEVIVSPAVGAAAAASSTPRWPPGLVVQRHREETGGGANQGEQEYSSSTDQHGANPGHMAIKGKRTKRPRAPSTSNSYSSSGTVTEEEEDMANCLILLAQGEPQKPGENAAAAAAAGSRRPAEPVAAGKGGLLVYECKTCSRCFPTFQALGGHRASHKKPKAAGVEACFYNPAAPAGVECAEEKTRRLEHVLTGPHPQLQAAAALDSAPLPASVVATSCSNNIIHKSSGSHNDRLGLVMNHSGSSVFKSTASRVHECSICGSEFQSGQALGGHMRRHRAAAAAAAASIVPGSPPQLPDPAPSKAEVVVTKPSVVLPLDLNLPAPSDEADLVPKPPPAAFPFSASSKRPAMLFSASPLVDCHY